jgi:hypothetical protein
MRAGLSYGYQQLGQTIMATALREKSPSAGKDDLKTFARALQQLVRSAPGVLALPKTALAQSASISLKDTDALSDHVGAIVDLFVPDAKSHTRLQRREAARVSIHQIIQQGELVPSGEFVERLGVTRQALSKAVAAHRLFYVEIGGDRYFPAFFLDLTYDRHQLEQVSKALGELPGASKLQFFRGKKASLGGFSPLQALVKGEFTVVRNAAAGFAER